MKKGILIFITALFSIGCSYVTTAAPTTETVNGDVWYVKNKAILSLVVAADIYYCPVPTQAPAACQQAVIVENEAAPPAQGNRPGNANGGYNAQQPSYGPPPAQQPPGYGAPGQQYPAPQQQPVYNSPAAPAAPAAPGTPAAPGAPAAAPAPPPQGAPATAEPAPAYGL